MGKSIIGTVSDQMMALFAANLEAMMAEPAAADPLSGEAATAAEPLGLLAAVAFIAFKPGRSDNNRPRGRSARRRSSPLTLDCAPVYPVLTAVAAPECPITQGPIKGSIDIDGGRHVSMRRKPRQLEVHAFTSSNHE